MPMKLRQKKNAERAQQEEERRQEAREAGIVLEKATGKSGKKARRPGERDRDRGVGGPSVGRMKGGMLTLSKRDVAEIERSGRGPVGRRGRGRR
jgi:hypothetical protein